MTKKHAKLSPSASKRWISCPGSIAFCDKLPPQKETSYSIEGTQAHHLAEHCLNHWVDAHELLGQKLSCNGERYMVDAELADAVQVYLDQVRLLAPKKAVENLDVKLNIEQTFDLNWLHPGMFGSNDASVYDVISKKLTVFDYKHGVGVIVEPEWNSQLMIYALGAMHSIWSSQTPKTKSTFGVLDTVHNIDLVIVQPRAISDTPVKTWSVSAENIWFWGTHILTKAAQETEKEGAKLSAGEHCRFCPALAVCPEQLKRACEVAKIDFDLSPTLPPPESLSPFDLAKVMETAELFNAWSKEVKNYAQTLAESGQKIPGYKLVSRRSERKWVDETYALDILESHLGGEAYTTKILSVAQAEKALKRKGVSSEATLDGLYEKPDAGLTLAPDTDRREEKVSQVVLDFLDGEEFLN